MIDVIELTRSLVEIPSVTGEEKLAGEFLFSLLHNQGWVCDRQEVAADRFNVVARRGRPEIILSTHMDTVPPFFGFREDEEFVYGRGACDAKGIIATMICAAQELVAEGETDLGLLFVVGEETDSAGAKKARDLDLDCSFVIDGEPTDNELVVGHKGMLYARIKTTGVTAHSAYPDQGESAIDKLLDILVKLRALKFPEDSRLGETYLNVGTIHGGRAPNVIPDAAEAEILIRTVAASARYVEILQELFAGEESLEVVATSEPQVMESVAGFPTKVVGYGTDVPSLRSLGKPLLVGPGSILEAHTAQEKVAKQELRDAIALYKQLIRLLKRER